MNSKDEEFFSKLMIWAKANNVTCLPEDKLIGTIKYAFQYRTPQSTQNTLRYYCDIGYLQAGVSGYLITEAAKKKYWGEKNV